MTTEKQHNPNVKPQRLSCLLTSVMKKKTGLSVNSTKQKRYLRYLTDIQKVSIAAELAWTTVT